MKKLVVIFLLIVQISSYAQNKGILLEAEGFKNKGGWVVDPQFVEEMGSPYLLAHGMGVAVANAKTSFKLKSKGEYHIWVRTKNWVPGEWEAPGKFKLKINDRLLESELGTKKGWTWQYVGKEYLAKKEHQIELVDLTGFDGRCDAIYLSKKNVAPPENADHLSQWRTKMHHKSKSPKVQKEFDLVVIGGGIAGCAAAIAAAEKDLKVALIHDRPVLGGNASSEVRVHTLGIYGHFERIMKMIDTEHYPNGSKKAYKEDEKRLRNIEKYINIHLFLNWRAFDAYADNDEIEYVDAKNIISQEIVRFKAPLFVDCTGDGWIGYWAKAKYMYGRESSDKFGEAWDKYDELWSPKKADNRVMGTSLLWNSYKTNTVQDFPEVPWAIAVAKDNEALEGGWRWEYSTNDLNQIDDAEQIRDHMLRAIYGSFYNAKQKEGNENVALEWVSYISGKRESRRLVGDHIYTFNDVRTHAQFPDSVVVETREIDVHYQQHLKENNKPDFLSRALFYETEKYYVPYRSLYSKNIENLFMAGRCFSCSHVGLGGPRVMNTTGQMGAAVGYAAYLCKKYQASPRDIYMKYLKEYMEIVLNSNKNSFDE